MSHFLQKQRVKNLELVKKTLAKTMPLGAKDQIFQAILMRNFGFQRVKVADYLSVLIETGEIELDYDTKRWRLTIPETEDNQAAKE